jgi:hypothetical protein
MACETIASILPVSSLGFGAVDQLIQKIPQAKPGKTKTWQELQKMVGVALWLSNPSNLAALKQIIDSFGTLEGLMLMANLLSYAGMDGIIDFGKAGASLAKIKSAFDCINQNINAITTVENQVINTVQGVLTTSNIFAMLGVSNVMESLGITDSYAFSQLSSEMTSKIGFAGLSSVPGINGVIPFPPSVASAEQTAYTVNSLTQTIYLLSQTPTNPVAQEALQKTAQAASIVAPSVASQQISTLPQAPDQTILSAVSKGTDAALETMTARADNASAWSTLSATAQSVPTPAPSAVPSPSIPSATGGTAPMSATTAQALVSQGPVAIGNLQDAANKTSVLIGDNTEILLWKRRQVQFLLKKYQAEFYQVDKDLKEIASMGAQAPLTAGSGALDLVPLLSILQSRNPGLLERYRVLDFKIKNLQHDLFAIDSGYTSSQSNMAQLQTYSSALQQFSPTNNRPYSASDPRTASKVSPTNSCGWVYLDSTIPGYTLTGESRSIQVLFYPGANNPVQPSFKSWLQLVIAATSKQTDISSITISSTSRPLIPGKFSWHAFGSAVDIAQINGVHVYSIGGVAPVATIQTVANSQGANEDYGPYTMLKDDAPHYQDPILNSEHTNHIHLSMRSSMQVCNSVSEGTSSQVASQYPE